MACSLEQLLSSVTLRCTACRSRSTSVAGTDRGPGALLGHVPLPGPGHFSGFGLNFFPWLPLHRRLTDNCALSTTDSGLAPGLELVPLTFGRDLRLFFVSTPRLLCHQGTQGTRSALGGPLPIDSSKVQLRSRTGFNSPVQGDSKRSSSDRTPLALSLRPSPTLLLLTRRQPARKHALRLCRCA
jgi:hypothetical protein